MAINTSDYLLQQLVNQNKDNNDSLTAIRELLADNLKQNSKKKTGSSSPGSPRPGGSGGRGGSGSGSGNKNTFGKMFKSLSSEVSNVSKTMMNSSANVSTVVNSLGMSASSAAGALTMIPGPIGVAATAFKMVADVGMAVYNVLNAQLEVYTKINSAGVALAEGYGSVLKGAGASMMSVDNFAAALQTHSAVVAQLDGVYGDGVSSFGKLLGSVQLAQNQLGLYGVSQQTLTDLTARNIKFQKQYGGSEMIRNMNQAQSSEQFITTLTKFSKSIGESVDSLLNKTKNLDKSIDTRSMIIALKNYSKLPKETAALTSKAFNEAASSMGDMGSDYLRLISHRLSIGGIPDDLFSPVLNEVADLGEYMVKSGITDANVIRQKQIEYVRANRETIEQDILYQRSIGNEQAALFESQLLDLEAAANDPKNSPADKLTQFTNRFNMWISKTFSEPFNKLYADTQNSVVDYLSGIADRTDGAWEFLWEFAKDGFGLIPIAKDAIEYVDGLGAEFSTWLDNLGSDLMGGSYDKISNAFNSFIDNLVDLPGKLWDSVSGWFGGGEKEKPKTQEPSVDVTNKSQYITTEQTTLNKITDSVMGLFDSIYTPFKQWNDARTWTPPKPTDKEAMWRMGDLISSNNGKKPISTPRIEKTENVVPDVVLERKMFDKSAWKPGEAPYQAEKPIDFESFANDRKDLNITNRADVPQLQAMDEQSEILKRLADASEASLSAIQQTNNFLRTISENTQGERNS